MPRTWGYIIIVAAVIIGASSLLMPVPETVEIAPVAPPKTEPPPRPAAAPTPQRARQKQVAPPVRETKPPARTVPMQDTTKTRQLIQPKPAG
jgi:hypothetical protein